MEQISASCALLDNDSIKCWGLNSNAELGLEDIANSNRGDNPGEMGDALPAIKLGTVSMSVLYIYIYIYMYIYIYIYIYI